MTQPTPPTKAQKRNAYYLDNAKFKEYLTKNKEYADKEKVIRKSKELTEDKKKEMIDALHNTRDWNNIKNVLGVKFMKIAKKRMMIKRYSGYSEDRKAEMLSDALYTMWKYTYNFDPTRGTSAFSYYTQIANHVFNNYIDKRMKDSERFIPTSWIDNLEREDGQENWG